MRTRCPCCGTTASLDVLVAHEDARAALSSVFQISQPLGTAMVRYLSLFRPATRELTMARVATIVSDLLPNLSAGSIPRKGRDWAVSPQDWCQAIDQMLIARDTSKLTLPLSGHGYLLEVLASLSDKAERVQEQAAEANLRNRGHASNTVTVRGRAVSIGEGLEAVFGGRDPALAKLDADAKTASPMSTDVRQQLAALRAKTLAKGSPL